MKKILRAIDNKVPTNTIDLKTETIDRLDKKWFEMIVREKPTVTDKQNMFDKILEKIPVRPKLKVKEMLVREILKTDLRSHSNSESELPQADRLIPETVYDLTLTATNVLKHQPERNRKKYTIRNNMRYELPQADVIKHKISFIDNKIDDARRTARRERKVEVESAKDNRLEGVVEVDGVEQVVCINHMDNVEDPKKLESEIVESENVTGETRDINRVQSSLDNHTS